MLTPTPDGLLVPVRLGAPPPPGHPLADVYARLEAGEDGMAAGPHGTLISTEILRAWPDEAREAIGLRVHAGSLDLREDGVAGDPRYRLRLKWEGGPGIVIGPFLIQGERIALLPPRLAEAAATAESLAGQPKHVVFREIGRLQALQRAGTPLRLGDRLGTRRIQVATRLRVRLREDAKGGSPRPTPVFTTAEGEELELLPDQVAKIASEGLLNDNTTALDGDRHVISTPELVRAALITALAGEANEEDRARFNRDPLPFLADSTDQSSVFDEADYSARVIGVGAAPERASVVNPTPQDWISADVPKDRRISVPTADGGTVEVACEQAAALAAEVRAAVEAGEGTTYWDGHRIPASTALATALAEATSVPSRRDGTAPPRADVIILRIRDNEFELDWSPGLTPREVRTTHTPTLRRPLRDHQEIGVRLLRERWERGERGALLCDDMGLGKTTQALVFSAWAANHMTRRSAPADATAGAVDVPVAIVAPRSLLQNWLREVEVVLDGDSFASVLWCQRDTTPNVTPRTMIRFHDYAARGGAQGVVLADAHVDVGRIQRLRPDLLLVAYDTLRVWQHALGRLHIGVLIADEAQEVKDPGSLRSLALRAMHYEFGVVLTGTPVENSWADLWTLADVAVPGLLGPLAKFRQDYPQEGDVRATGARLAARLRGPLIRRLRSEVLTELPELRVSPTPELMPDVQRIAYSAARSVGASGQGALGLLQRLARISLHPRQRLDLRDKYEAETWLLESARTAVLLRALREWQPTGEPVLVFVRSRAMQDTLAHALRKIFVLEDVPVLNGEASDHQRQRLVSSFAEGDGFRVLLVSPDVGGAGWNLQFACRSVLLERPYNPAVEDQMIARTHRLGQPNPVEVIIPVALHPELRSYDQVLDELLREKRAAADGVLTPAAGLEPGLERRLGEAVLGGAE